ncbi:fungal hydrophobin [Heliocybe sulcata]|uniref:Hydrophobin n=1 Tax=Heliocybe sulcata TaxID=5364 RepID=A0A5C3ML75_9AGAM|nr:fungal hydrophobin [Heliocybe sulcata]
MFSKLSLAVIGALAILAAATPALNTPPSEPASQCATSDLQCCNSVSTTSDPAVITALGSLGIALQDVTGLVGLTCSPITAIGIGSGGSCTESPVCCSDNAYGGLVSIGCVPVTL